MAFKGESPVTFGAGQQLVGLSVNVVMLVQAVRGFVMFITIFTFVQSLVSGFIVQV